VGRWLGRFSGLLGLFVIGAAPCGAVYFPFKTIPIGSSPSVVAIGDLNGDGHADVAVGTRAAGDPVNDRSVFVFLQKAHRTLSAPIRYPIGVEARGIAIGDLNGDGRADLAIAGGNGVVVLLQNPSGGLEQPRFLATGSGAESVAIGDLNGDGRADLAVSHSDDPQISVLYQTPDGRLTPPTRYPVSDTGSTEIAIGDVTGDGLADLVFIRGRAGLTSLWVFPQDAASHTLRRPSRYGWGEERATHGLALADLNGDRRLDVVMSWGDTRPECGLGIFHQTAEGALQPAVPYGSADVPEAIKAADIDQDGRMDLVVVHGGWQNMSTYLQQPDGTLGEELLNPLPFTEHYEPQGLALGDLDGDGYPDVAIADANNGLVLLYNAGARDITPPDTVILGNPATLYNSSSVTFRFSGTDETTQTADLQYRWNVDAGEWSPFSAATAAAIGGLSEGWHDFSVTARDVAGNIDGSPAALHFLVDLTPPSGLTLKGVGDYTNAVGVAVFAVAEDNLADYEDLTFAWRVDDGPWSDFSYARKLTLQHLFQGAHRLEAKASDPAGNVSDPAGISFIVDRTPPDTRVDGISHSPANGAVTIRFSGNDNFPPPNRLTYAWRVDNGPWSSFTPDTQATLTGLTAGSHRFEVRARDTAGNVDATPAVQEF
jgi:hypothetical protein